MVASGARCKYSRIPQNAIFKRRPDLIMKPHCAAALALVGWYLMVPPGKRTLGAELVTPLAQWVTIKSFDAADDCESARRQMLSPTEEEVKKTAKDAGVSVNDSQATTAAAEVIKCVASDDPRLKGN